MPHTFLGRRDFLAIAASALASPALSRSGAPVASLEGRAFGTHWRISLPGGEDGDALRAPVSRLLSTINTVMSPWRRDSEISRFNAAGAGIWPLSAETSSVMHASLEVARLSSGAFDPTVGPLVARWGFGPIVGSRVPGWEGVRIDGNKVEKTRPGLTLDPCGIAKGYALDRISLLLRERGLADHLVDFGGELVARGRHPSGRAWQVGVEDPRPGVDGLAETLWLRNAAVATSGGKASGYTLRTRRYSHIIDPATEAPVAGDLLSVSVIADTAMMADAWATACMAAGAARAPDLARRQGLSALMILRDGPRLRRVTTGIYDAHRV